MYVLKKKRKFNLQKRISIIFLVNMAKLMAARLAFLLLLVFSSFLAFHECAYTSIIFTHRFKRISCTQIDCFYASNSISLDYSITFSSFLVFHE